MIAERGADATGRRRDAARARGVGRADIDASERGGDDARVATTLRASGGCGGAPRSETCDASSSARRGVRRRRMPLYPKRAGISRHVSVRARARFNRPVPTPLSN